MVNPKSNDNAPSLQVDLRKDIEDFYLPKHLVKAIYAIGHIPSASREGQVGVGFIDIADYTYLSKFLSPKENQILLNGLYTAFQMVLERHGGYLNKIEGDSMMFHFDDILDRRLWNLAADERINFIARELFYTCVEIQRICTLFNQADDHFLDDTASAETRQALLESFEIIKALRGKDDLSSTLFAFFQIRIRVGANIGEVTIGNFGPAGSKHWDIIGLPVINAKRMESTAPVGGFRISTELFKILERSGIARDYFNVFRLEAARAGNVYAEIKFDELFDFREVVVYDKKGATYKTYSVQVSPVLPESICSQAEELLKHGEQGAHRIIEFIQYYRGNHYVINLLEAMLESKGVVFRKDELLSFVSPKFAKGKGQNENLSLFTLLKYISRYQDLVQVLPGQRSTEDFFAYDQYMAGFRASLMDVYEKRKKVIIQKTWFFEVVFPLVYASLEASLREYQIMQDDLEASSLEMLAEDGDSALEEDIAGAS
jgi:class 3 adenylate cyclase